MERTLGSKIEQEQFVSRRLVVKIGSSAITEGATNHEPLNKGLIEDIARQCSELYKTGVRVSIVTSGSVACGRYLLHLAETDIVDRQVEAAFGQPFLIKTWIDAFREHGVKASQILLSETDLGSAKLPLSRSMDYGIPIINANDSVSDQEMKEFLVSADNDRLAKFVAIGIEADTLLILTDVPGILDEDGNLIENGGSIDIEKLNGKSDKGTGGIKSKALVAKELSMSGVDSFIARAADEDIVLNVAKRQTQRACTSFTRGVKS